jgi:hypothetical protein
LTRGVEFLALSWLEWLMIQAESDLGLFVSLAGSSFAIGIAYLHRRHRSGYR